METFIVRVWLPDRPGALGAVASRIGAVRGDVVGIDILERGAGTAVDELVVTLPDASVVALLVNEIGEVDGVQVESVRPTAGDNDARLDALDTAAVLVAAPTQSVLVSELLACARRIFETEWAAVVHIDDRLLVAAEGSPPP
ncbi:MAG: amino acid-binding protein, partial [Acidimicrobiales bacterium]